MIRIMISVLFLLPALSMSQKCPKFQSVIQLRPTATPLNFSYAIVADGNYYLLDFQHQNRKNLEPTGLMPKGFEESRLITLIDRSDCNNSEYYLMAIKTSRNSADSAQTNYSTLDLLNWSPKSKWSDPKLISEHPLFSSDPYIETFKELDPNIQIEDYVQTLFYWEQTQTYFVVTKPLQRSPSETTKSSSLRYYLIDSHMACDNKYSSTKQQESLSTGLNTVIEPLDFCFFSHPTGLSDPLLYCIGGKDFQVNQIASQYQNGSFRSQSVGIPEELPTIDRLRVLAGLCREEETTSEDRSEDRLEEKDRIRVRIDQIRIGVIEGTPQRIGSKDQFRSGSDPESYENFGIPTGRDKLESVSQPNPEEEDSSSTFIIVLVCLAIFVLIMIGILIIAARRQQQIAKM